LPKTWLFLIIVAVCYSKNILFDWQPVFFFKTPEVLEEPCDLVLKEFSVDLLPSRVHSSDRFPGVPPGVVPLGTGHAHGPVVSSDAVQTSFESRHPATASATAHRRERRPTTHPGVEPLNTGLVVARVEAAKGVDTFV